MAETRTLKVNRRALYPMKPDYPFDYYVEVRAIDSYGLKSEPIVSDVIPGDPEGLVETPESSLDPQNQWQYKAFTTFDYLEEGYQPEASVDFDSWPTSKAEDFHPYLPVSNNGFAGSPAITKQINGGANQFDCWSWYTSEENFSSAFNTDFEGALEFWAWGDFSEVDFDYFYFAFRQGVFYGNEYKTEVSTPLEGAHFYIQDGQGGWIEKDFGTDGKMYLGSYKGFVRFSSSLFCNESGVPLLPLGLKTI